MRAVFALAIVVALGGCASHSVRNTAPAAPLAETAAFIDLQPGWRLRVITPLTRSGVYVIHSTTRKITPVPGGLALTATADADFIGYQTAYYAVGEGGREGVRIDFTSAEDTKGGVVTPQPEPRPRLFQLPQRARYVRLVYLARMSRADHDMAIVAATNRSLLDLVTKEIQAHPAACLNTERTFCSWVPAGIAVRPEIPMYVNGSVHWEPAR